MTEPRERLFGNDLGLAERHGGLDLYASPNGDLALARGNENIVQALGLRLRVRKGELASLGWPDFGSRIHELIGEPNNARTHVLLVAFARAAIEADPRVVEVEAAEVVVLPTERLTARLNLEVRVIDEPNPLNLVFDLNIAAP